MTPACPEAPVRCARLGVSIRQVERLVESLGITRLSKSQAWRWPGIWDEQIQVFRTARSASLVTSSTPDQAAGGQVPEEVSSRRRGKPRRAIDRPDHRRGPGSQDRWVDLSNPAGLLRRKGRGRVTAPVDTARRRSQSPG